MITILECSKRDRESDKMAIHCMDPNTVGSQAESLVTCITSTTGGKGILDKFENTITNLRNHWTGSDAYRNINDLIKVYNSTKELLTSVQKYIIEVNNEQILPLQKDIINDGGECTLGNELTLVTLGTEISAPPFIVETRTEDAMVTDAEEFSNVPTTFQTFVTEINSLKKTLLNNWLDGAGRENVVKSFETFNEDVTDSKTILDELKKRLDTIAANKKKIM